VSSPGNPKTNPNQKTKQTQVLTREEQHTLPKIYVSVYQRKKLLKHQNPTLANPAISPVKPT
jgi:hypothetical protein